MKKPTRAEKVKPTCQYIDLSTGVQCNNLPRYGHAYCRKCARRAGSNPKYERLNLTEKVEHSIKNKIVSPNASSLLSFENQEECFRYLSSLKNRIDYSQVILHGSYAQSRAHTWSDIDLAVISNQFANMPFIKRTILLREVALKAKTPKIQAVGFTRREFETGDYPRIVYKVRKGVSLFRL